MAASPEMMNWLCQSPKWLRVWAATILTIRLPATGPTVQNPMAEAAELGAEVTDEGRRGHQDGPLDEPHGADDGGEGPLARGVRDADGEQEADDQQAVDDDVGPPEGAVWLAGREANAPMMFETMTMPT